MALVKVTSETQLKGIISKGVSVIDFWAEWCGPCRVTNPLIEELSKEFGDKVTFAKVNIDENPALAEKNSIMAVPTFLFYKEGKLSDSLVGAAAKSQFKEKISELMEK
ncbi:MAG: thioredoxin [Candidatus Diapherotrites archaeon]|nr:thioredoxin [Candidatus Diapherotrites archaeon]